MNTKNTEYLYKKYPLIFKKRKLPMRETCMCWGLECGDGWFTLIDQLCQVAMNIHYNSGLCVVANQVKEKYGTLRFYFSIEADPRCIKVRKGQMIRVKRWVDGRTYHKPRIPEPVLIDEIDRADARFSGAVSMADNMSAHICELCGAPGTLDQSSGWYSTRCSKCKKAKK